MKKIILMKKLGLVIAIVLGILVLSGCIPTVFVTGAAVGGSVVYDHRNPKIMLQDRNTALWIQYKFDNDKELYRKAHVSVAMFNCIALLVGQAPTEELRDRAEAIAKTRSQIKMLYNEITIEQLLSHSVYAHDSWITTKIKAALLTKSGLNSTDLKVVTENGVVYLMGLTTRIQAQLAVDKIRTIAGVKKIVKLFEYLN